MWHGVVADLTMFVDVGGLALLGGSLVNTSNAHSLPIGCYSMDCHQCLH